MVCLDTGFLVALLRGDQEAASTAETLDRANARKTTTPINAFELLLGAQLSKQREENLPLRAHGAHDPKGGTEPRP